MFDRSCKVCGKTVMGEEYCVKKGTEILRFCCEQCMDKYEKGYEKKTVTD